MAKFANLMDNDIASGAMQKQQGVKKFTYTPTNFVAKPKSTPLLTALSTNKTANVKTNTGTNYKPLAVPTSAQKMANLGIDFKPTAQSQINTINGISNKTITPTPMVQDKQTDTDVERGFYALGNVLAGDNANTVLGGLRYDLARGLGGVIGDGAGLVTQASGLVNQGLSALTSLGGTAPNAVSKWFDEGAKYALDRDVSGAMSAGIENSVEGKKNWSSNITGNLYETVGNIMTGKAAGGAISGFTKLAPEVASKLAMGLSAGGQGATNAYNEGATPQQAISFGNAVAGLEMATESMFGGVPGLGKGVFDDIIKGLKKSPTALKALVDMVGEGGEEVLSSFLTPYLQRILYNPEAKNATVNELLTSFAYGAGLSGLMQAPAVIGSIGSKPNVAQQPAIPSTNVQNTALNGENNVQVVPNNMQNQGQILTPNLPKPNANKADVSVQENVSVPQQAVQAPVSDFKPQVATDTAKAVEVDAVQQVKPEAQTNANSNVQSGLYIDDRTYKDVSSPKVKAFQYDNPELHQNFVQAAIGLKSQLQFTTKGERWALKDENGYFVGSDGVKRSTTKQIEFLHDDANLKYDLIGKAIDDIIADHGQENYAAAKKVELVLDDMLSNGYEAEGYNFPLTKIIFKKEAIKNNTDYRMTEDEWNALMADENQRTTQSIFPSTSLGAKITKGMPQGTGAKSAEFVPEQKVSEFYSNTLLNTDSITEEQKENLNERDYVFDSVSEKQSKQLADQRIEADFDGEVEALSKANTYTAAEDVDTAMGILEKFSDDNDFEKMASWSRNMYKKVHGIAVSLQALDKYSRTPEGAVIKAQGIIDEAVRKLTTKKEFGKEVDKPVGRKIKAETAQAIEAVAEESKAVANEIEAEVKKAIKPRENKPAKKSNLNPLAQKTDAEKAAEKLANKVDSTTKEKKAPEVNAINDMVNELFKSAKESPLPKQASLKKRSPIEFLTQAIKNKAEYTDVWGKAKDILLEKYADEPEVLEMLNDYFEKGIVPTYSDATLTSSVKQALKDIGTKLSEIKELSWADRQKAIKAVTNYLVEQTGAIDGDAKALNRDAADKITMLIIDSAPKLTKRQKLEIKQATQDAMRKHGVPVESWADETGRLLAEGVSKTIEPQNAPKDKAITQIITDDIKKFVGTIPKPIKTVVSRNAIDTYTDFMENRQYYTEAWAKLQADLKAKYANNPEALKAIDTIINRTAETAATDYYNKQLDSMINKALKSINVKLSELVTQGNASKEAVVKAVSDVLIKEHGIEGEAAKTISENIAERFNDMLQAKAKQRIANILKTSDNARTGKKKSMNEMLNRLVNLSSFDMDSLGELIKFKYGISTLTAADVQKIYEFNKLAQETTDDYQRRVFNNRAARVIANRLPTTVGNKILAIRRISMLLNVKTLISRNAGYNALFGMILEDIKDLPGTGIDMLVSLKTHNRETSYNPIATTIAEAKGFKKGLVEWGKDVKEGADSSPTQHEMPQAPSFKGKLGRGVEETLNKLLQLGDRPFFESAYAKRIDEMKRLGKDVNTTEAAEQATAYALERVFQNDSAMAQRAFKLRESLGVFGDVMLPFVQTPANIFDKLADYSPVGFYRAVKKFGAIGDSGWSQKQFTDTLARAMTGTGIILAGYFGFLNGLITGGDDDKTEEEKYLDKQAGILPYSIRFGGTSYTYDSATVIGPLLGLGADMAQAGNAEETLMGILRSGMNAGINTMFNQSYLEGLSDLFASEDIGKGVESMLVNLPSSFVPTQFAQIAKIVDTNMRDTYDSNPAKRAWNKMKAKTPFLSMTLPTVIGANGEPMKNFQGRGVGSNIFESLLSPGFIGQNKQTAVDKEVSRLFEVTGDKSVLPDWSSYTSKSDFALSAGGKPYTLTTAQLKQYQATAGKATYDLVGELLKDKSYNALNDADKTALVKSLIGYANDTAKREFVGNTYVSNDYAKVYDAEKAGIAPVSYFVFKSNLSKIDTNGSPTQVESTQAINQTNLSQADKGKLWGIQNSDANPNNNPYTGTLAQAKIPTNTTIAIMEFESNAKADKDANGKSISGTKKKKVLDYAKTLGLNSLQINAVCTQYGWTPVTNYTSSSTGKFSMS